MPGQRVIRDMNGVITALCSLSFVAGTGSETNAARIRATVSCFVEEDPENFELPWPLENIIEFEEIDGTKRRIVWDKGDSSVPNCPPGYVAENDDYIDQILDGGREPHKAEPSNDSAPAPGRDIALRAIARIERACASELESIPFLHVDFDLLRAALFALVPEPSQRKALDAVERVIKIILGVTLGRKRKQVLIENLSVIRAALSAPIIELGNMGLEIPPHIPEVWNVRRIVEIDFGYEDLTYRLECWLKEHEYDGLFRQDRNEVCGCGISGTFVPCDDGPYGDCEPAYAHSVAGYTVYSPDKFEEDKP